MITLLSQLVELTCLSQPLHSAVEGGGGPSGGSGSEGEKEVGCVGRVGRGCGLCALV